MPLIDAINWGAAVDTTELHALYQRHLEQLAAQMGLSLEDLQGPTLHSQDSTLRQARVGNEHVLAHLLGSDWKWEHDPVKRLVSARHARGLWFRWDTDVVDRGLDLEAARAMAEALLDAVEDHVKGEVCVFAYLYMGAELGSSTWRAVVHPASQPWKGRFEALPRE